MRCFIRWKGHTRCCAVYDSKRRRVAEIEMKAAVGGVAIGVDVFHLIVQHDMVTAVAMYLVILLDQMYGTSGHNYLVVVLEVDSAKKKTQDLQKPRKTHFPI
ncbi:hypothetical protein ACFX1R_000078 [Malus domestica]